MINLSFAKNKTYYLYGMGTSNKGALKALQKAEAEVFIWDDDPDNLKKYDEGLLRDPDKLPWSRVKAIVVAPGLPPHHPINIIAVEKNIPVICDIELLAQAKPETTLIGVTGTNGKSTLTALLGHILNCQVGGNIGKAALSLKHKSKYTVLELSSYQLARSPSLVCDVGVLLNITADHLAWHDGIDNYAAAKEHLIKNAATKIVSIDDDYCQAIYDRQAGVKAPLTIHGDDLPVKSVDFPRLKGNHNFQNILAAYAVCRALNMAHDDIVEKIESFEGLPHRQYVAGVINGIAYINDSKATNGEATRHALLAHPGALWIVGGRPKESGLSGLDKEIASMREAYVYGEAAQEFEKFIKACGIPVHVFETLDQAFTAAHGHAQSLRGAPGGTPPSVLFSPACASFDQFDSFEQRGDHFCHLVETVQNTD